jgi:hypothetical protein
MRDTVILASNARCTDAPGLWLNLAFANPGTTHEPVLSGHAPW